MIRNYVDDADKLEAMKNKNNLYGETPSEMYHNVKFELTDDEDDIAAGGECPTHFSALGYEEETHSVPLIDKKRLYQAPDYAFVAKKKSIAIIKK